MSLEEAKRRIAVCRDAKATELDLSDLRLTELPEDDLRTMPSVTSLNLKHNSVGPNGAKVIAKAFPNLVFLNIDSCYITSEGLEYIAEKLPALKRLDAQFNHLDGESWQPLSKFEQLTYLDISINDIGDEGIVKIAQHLRNLRHFSAVYCDAGLLAVEAISLYLTKLTRLNVREAKMGDVGAIRIAQGLPNLTHLDVGYCGISAKGAVTIARLDKLKSLDVSGNLIEDYGADYIAQLRNLERLMISECGLTSNGARSIAEGLHQLTQLNIYANDIGNDGAIYIASLLRKLEILSIGSANIGSRGAKAIAIWLNGLTTLSIENNNIGDTGIIAIAQNLTRLEVLNVEMNAIEDEGIIAIAGKLRSLRYLIASHNSITNNGAFAVAENLRKLTYLSLDDNKIKDDGAIAIVKGLPKLKQLNITNNLIGDKGLFAIAYCNIETLYIRGNKPEEIPQESADDINLLRSYLGSIEIFGKEKGNVVRLVLCGNSLAGKTSLATKLDSLTSENPAIGDRTHGIKHWQLSKTIRKKDFFINIWDFGGQDYYHATHAAALNTRDKEKDNEHTIYLLVWNNYEHKDAPTEEGQCMPVDYWLGFIEQLAGNVRPEMIQTYADVSVCAFPESVLLKESGNLFSPDNFHFLSLKTDALKNAGGKERKRWDRFSKYLNDLIEHKSQSAEYPTVWKNIREQYLPELSGKYKEDATLKKTVYTREQLETALMQAPIMKDVADYEKADALQYEGLLQYLKNCGEILYWKDSETSEPLLREHVVINIEQFHNDIYDRLLTKDVKDNRGIFEPSEKFAFHTAYLLNNGLIFKLRDEVNKYVAPQYLPEEPLIAHFRDLIPLTLVLRFPYYMPRYMITKFIVLAYELQESTSYWKYGCISSMEDTKFMVRIDVAKQEVYFHVQDVKGKYDLLKKLFYYFGSYGEYNPWERITPEERAREDMERREKIKPEEKVKPEVQLSENGYQFTSFKDVRQAIKDLHPVVRTADGHYARITPAMQQLANPDAPRPKKIFFSYSKNELQYCTELQRAFAPLKRQGYVELFYDGMIEAGKSWDARIKKELEDADIVLCLLSNSFMDNDYIVNVEMNKAAEKKDKNAVVPIYISKCDTSATFFSEPNCLLNVKHFPEQNPQDKSDNGKIWIAMEEHQPTREYYYGLIVEQLTPLIKNIN